jgi:hypothetical protein
MILSTILSKGGKNVICVLPDRCQISLLSNTLYRNNCFCVWYLQLNSNPISMFWISYVRILKQN